MAWGMCQRRVGRSRDARRVFSSLAIRSIIWQANVYFEAKGAMADDLIGQTLGQYQIQALLGKGGMSSVYRAYQATMGRTVAIKVLPREFLHDDTFLARFQREARTIARLEHLHILPVYDVGEHDGIPYIVMRYLSGGTLADLIEVQLPDLPTVVRVVGQVAEALDYAHERGIIHRDLKPSNVLLDEEGNAYLADFGIARVAQQATSLTGSRIVGTPPYVAPEMVRKGEQVTGSVDIYALGVITYQMLVGEPPYVDDDPMAVLMAHVLEPVPSVRDLDPNISPEVDRVLRRCLAKSPKERYRAAGDFARALAEAAQVGVVQQAPPAVPGTADTPPKERVPVPEPEPAAARRISADTPPSGVHPRIDFEPGAPGRRKVKSPERARRGGFGLWLMVLVVIAVVVVAVGAVAYTVTDGDLARLTAMLTPFPTRSLRPTATGTPPEPTGAGPPDTRVPTEVPPALPPPGGGDRLAFASNRDGDYEIYLIDIDGTGLRQLTDNDGVDFDPAWSPDGRQIVFAHRPTVNDDSEIMVMNVDGSNVRQLTDNEFSDTDPDWSPDGEWIAFASNREGSYDIYVMRSDGSDVRRLVDTDGLNDLAPCWSPDGKRIGYHAKVGNNRETSDLYVIDAPGPAGETGSAPYRLTDNETSDEWLDWSPDGLRIIFSSGQGLPEGQRGVFMMNLQTNVTVQITVDPVHDDDPAWSADGGWITFDSDRDGGEWFDLYVLDIASGALRQLTSEPGDDVTPAWQPKP